MGGHTDLVDRLLEGLDALLVAELRDLLDSHQASFPMETATRARSRFVLRVDHHSSSGRRHDHGLRGVLSRSASTPAMAIITRQPSNMGQPLITRPSRA